MKTFLIAAALSLASCSAAPFVLLVNPKNSTTVECSGMGRGGPARAVVSEYVNNCVQQYQALGYVRADQLTEEQKTVLDIKPPDKTHQAVDLPPIVVPDLAPRPSLNCTSNRIGNSTYTNCN